MSTTPALDALDAEPLMVLGKLLLDAIWFAPSRDAVATALAAGRSELVRRVSVGELDTNRYRQMLALLEMKAVDCMREFPVPGTPAPVGLLGGQK